MSALIVNRIYKTPTDFSSFEKYIKGNAIYLYVKRGNKYRFNYSVKTNISYGNNVIILNYDKYCKIAKHYGGFTPTYIRFGEIHPESWIFKSKYIEFQTCSSMYRFYFRFNGEGINCDS